MVKNGLVCCFVISSSYANTGRCFYKHGSFWWYNQCNLHCIIHDYAYFFVICIDCLFIYVVCVSVYKYWHRRCCPWTVAIPIVFANTDARYPVNHLTRFIHIYHHHVYGCGSKPGTQAVHINLHNQTSDLCWDVHLAIHTIWWSTSTDMTSWTCRAPAAMFVVSNHH